jgi:hypothetical protein
VPQNFKKFYYQIAGGILESLWYGNTWKLSHGWQAEKMYTI